MAALQKDFQGVIVPCQNTVYSFKKMQLQAMYKPNSSCCVFSRSPGTRKHRGKQAQMCPHRDVSSSFILHECNPHNQK